MYCLGGVPPGRCASIGGRTSGFAFADGRLAQQVYTYQEQTVDGVVAGKSMTTVDSSFVTSPLLSARNAGSIVPARC